MANPSSWAKIPTELKHAILSLVETEPSSSARCASVCKAWQSWFEHINFRHLFINEVRLRDFFSFVHNNPRRRSAVQKISIYIELNASFTTHTNHPEIVFTRQRALHDVLVNLLPILRLWTRTPGSPGITLVIHTVYSDTSIPTDNNLTQAFHPYYPEWYYSHLYPLPSLDAPRPLPPTPIVTSLILSGQYHQCLKYPTLSKLLRQSFTHLENLHIERLAHQESFWGEDYGEPLYPITFALPTTLKKWTFFDPYFFLVPSTGRRLGANQLPLRQASAHLEHIKWGWALDARDFFSSSIDPVPPHEHYVWSNLKTLSLTSSDMKTREGMRDILVLAGQAACYMPRLEWLEIWRGGDTHPDLLKGWRMGGGDGGGYNDMARIFRWVVDERRGKAEVSFFCDPEWFWYVWGEVRGVWGSVAERRGVELAGGGMLRPLYSEGEQLGGEGLVGLTEGPGPGPGPGVRVVEV